MAKRTMRVFDWMCLTPVEDMTPEEIRALRIRENQAVFARYLNVTTSLISPVEAWREAAAGRFAETFDHGREEWSRYGRVMEVAAPDGASPARTNTFGPRPPTFPMDSCRRTRRMT